MPELPEVETIVRGLRRPLRGRRVRAIEVLRPDLLDTTATRFSSAIVGASFSRVARRGKNLLLHLEAGPNGGRPTRRRPDGAAEPGTLVVNLGMSGRLLVRAPADSAPEPTHPGVRFRLDDGSVLVYHDVRRFGRLRVMDPGALAAWSDCLGPEPLARGFTARALEEALRRSAAPIRSWLLDQRRIAGVGNIYANEALFRARVHPGAPARGIVGGATKRLHRALRAVLREAIDSNGTTLRDYRTARGGEGSYGARLRVYGREGRPCPSCRRPIARVTFGGRSAYFCRSCQPRRIVR